MKHLLVPALSVLTIAAASCGSNTVSNDNKNAIAVADSTGAVLSEAEKAEGWQPLFISRRSWSPGSAQAPTTL